MSKSKWKKVLGGALALIMVASGLLLFSWLDASCDNEQRRIVMKLAGGVGCFEFWFNRYQSFAGNLLTAAVAGFALIWASGQLVAANKQVDAAGSQAAVAAAQAMRSVAEDYQTIREKLEQFGYGVEEWLELSDFSKPYVANSIAQNLISRADKVIDSAGDVLLPLEAVHLRTGAGEFYDLTLELSKRAGQILALAGEAQKLGNEGDLNGSRARFGDIQAACRSCIEANNSGLTLVRARTKETWIAIRAFQDRAIRAK